MFPRRGCAMRPPRTSPSPRPALFGRPAAIRLRTAGPAAAPLAARLPPAMGREASRVADIGNLRTCLRRLSRERPARRGRRRRTGRIVDQRGRYRTTADASRLCLCPPRSCRAVAPLAMQTRGMAESLFDSTSRCISAS